MGRGPTNLFYSNHRHKKRKICHKILSVITHVSEDSKPQSPMRSTDFITRHPFFVSSKPLTLPFKFSLFKQVNLLQFEFKKIM